MNKYHISSGILVLCILIVTFCSIHTVTSTHLALNETIFSEIKLSPLEATTFQEHPNANNQIEQSDEQEMVGLIFAYIVFPILFVLHMLLLIRYVKKSMFASSKNVAADSDLDVDPIELPAKEHPTCIYYDIETPKDGQLENREALIDLLSRAKWRVFRLVFTVCLLYPLLSIGLQLIFNGPRTDLRSYVTVFVIVYFIYIIISLVVNGKRRYIAAGRSFGFMLPQIRWIRNLLRALFGPIGFMLTSFFILYMLLGQAVDVVSPESEETILEAIEVGKMEVHPIGWEDELLSKQEYAKLISQADYSFGFGLFVAGAIHIFLLIGLWRKKYDGPNMKLLVLRVFGPTKGSEFTFNRLIRFWRFFGTYMTIDDPNFARHRFRFFQFRTLTIFMALVILGLALWYSGIIILVLVIVSDWHSVLKRGPARDRAHIQSRIQKVLKNPRMVGLMFKDLRTVSYMNTWKMTVAEFVKVADVILMDLRNYDKNREGCKYEVDYIMDSFPIDHIVFLMQGKSDSEAITELLYERWAELKVGSPNESLKNPILQLYISSDEKGDDVQALMDLLLTISQTPK